MVRREHFRAKYLLLILLLQACGNKPMPVYNATDVHVTPQNDVLMQDGKPFTGIIYAMQPNKKDTAEIVCFNRGKQHGHWKRFYADGKPEEDRYFDNGKKIGELKQWWPNGRLKLAYHFKNGEYEGQCREWTANGLLVANMNYNQGYEEGRQLQYYSNGKIKANYLMINGRRYGLLGTKNCVNVADSIFKK